MSVETNPVEALYMPVEMKLDLCMALLESVGADKINLSEERGEIIHCCVMPWHDENRPSASLNFQKMTYKCLGCGAQGGILWLIGVTQGMSGVEARAWLDGETGLGGKEFQLAPLLQYLDALDEAVGKGRATPMMPRFSEKVLEPWNYIYPGLTTGVEDLGITGRGIPEENLVESRVGWDMDQNRIIIPNFWNDALVGWQSRRIISDGSPKYKSTPDFPRDRTIMGRPKGRRVLVVESPMSRLRHMHHLPVASTWGAVVTAQQVALLKWYPEVCFWMDNDDAGWKTLVGYVDEKGVHHPGAAQQLQAYSEVSVVPSDWHADPAEFNDDDAAAMYDARIPLAIWEQPTDALRCLACKQCHGGPCA